MNAALKRRARENRRSFCAPVPAPDYYRTVYKEDFDAPRFYVCTTGSPRIRRADGFADVMSVASGRSDVYLHPCDFYSWPCLKSARILYSIKIDLDHVSAGDESALIASGFFGLRPTFAIRSGSGLHLDFILDEPLACYRWRIPLLQELMKRVQGHFRGRGSWRVDHTSLMQGFRVVGSRTKRGGVCRAYPVGEEWRISDLAAAVGVPDPVVRPASQGQERKEREQASRPRATAMVLPFPVISTGGRGFYSHVRGRIAAEVREGHRELALFALAVVGKKCGVPRDVVECDIRRLFDVFAARAGETPMREVEVEKSLVGYSDRYIRTRSTKLEMWLGFEFPRTTKRNGRERQEHARWCRSIRTEQQAEDRRARIGDYLAEHPDASNAELARELGITRRTAAKYRPNGPVSASELDAGGVSSNIAYNTGRGGAEMPFIELGEGETGRVRVCSWVATEQGAEKTIKNKNNSSVCASGSASVSVDSPCCEGEPPRTVGADPILSRLHACRVRVGTVSRASMPSMAASASGREVPGDIRARLERLKSRVNARAGP